MNNIFLIFFLGLFAFLTKLGKYINGEYSIIEFSQLIILISTILITIFYRKLFIGYSSFYQYLIRLLFFVFIFFEEISFITANKFSFIGNFNLQSEVNFHNLNFFNKVLFENLSVPFLDYQFSLLSNVLFYSLTLFILGYSSRLSFLRRYKILFFEKKLSIYSFVYLLNIVFTSILSNKFDVTYLNESISLIHGEYIELFIYILFLLDTFYKIQKIIKQKNNSI